MAFYRRWLLILCLLVLGGGQAGAAPSREERAYTAAVAAFHDELYAQAETELAQYIQRFPKSRRVAEAALLQAQARFKQGKFTEAIALLAAPPGDWGRLADQYAYWLGEAQFARGDFDHAAETFNTLARNFQDSRLTAVIGAAAAFARLGDWPQLERLLGGTNSVFALKAAQDSGNELISRGRLLLALAQFEQRNFTKANAALSLLNPAVLSPDLDWQRANLLCRVQAAAGDWGAALATTTNLLQLAASQDAGRQADSVAWRATVLEQLGRWHEASLAWRDNLKAGTPVEWQQQAILKIAAAAAEQKKFAEADAALGEFLKQFPDSPAASLALLTQGELNLRQHLVQPADTNQATSALEKFDQLLASTNAAAAELSGKAHLGRGWCHWLTGKMPESLADFQAAAEQLPFSEDLAVARFKTGDAQFAVKDFAGARASYQKLLDTFGHLPGVMAALGDRALYQLVRSGVELRDAAGAERAMQQLLEKFPASGLADNGLLLLGEGLSDFDSPTNAVTVFRDFAKRFPESSLRPQVELELARTFERAQDWPAAITSYEGWLKDFPTNSLRPEVEYVLGWANFQSGNETNALAQFTGFMTQFPTNPLAPMSQWWVADHYFRAGNFVGAETNYELIFQTPAWEKSDLYFPAKLMAGRAAAGRLGFSDAARYYTGMTADTNCPPPLATQAMFAYGGVLMRMDSADTNRPFANFELATNIFAQLCLANPTNELGALACSELGDCNLQLGEFDAATNAYARVMNSPYASIGLRCRAQVGLGRVIEKQAELLPPSDRQPLLAQALQNYWDVVVTSYGKGLRDDEAPEAFWVKKAGLLALPLLSAGSCPTNIAPDKFFNRMEELLPQLKNSLEKKKAALGAEKN
jgi:TolA-binding protein